MSLSTLMFPLRNYGFAVALGAIYWLIIWVFATTTLQGTRWHSPMVSNILLHDPEFKWFPHLFLVPPLAAANNVLLGIMCLVLWIVLYAYADSSYGTKIRVALATVHWAGHIAMMLTLYFLVSWATMTFIDWLWPIAAPTLQTLDVRASSDVKELIRSIVIFPLAMTFLGGIGAGLVWGAYLTISCLVGLHCDQAFASMGIPDWKNFLRMKIEPSKLTIYPIGLRKAPRRWWWRLAKSSPVGAASDGPTIVSSRPLRPTLIEGPIEIRVGDVKLRAAKGASTYV